MESIVQLTSMPLDSIAISFAVVAMFGALILALAWGAHQSGWLRRPAPNKLLGWGRIQKGSLDRTVLRRNTRRRNRRRTYRHRLFIPASMSADRSRIASWCRY